MLTNCIQVVLGHTGTIYSCEHYLNTIVLQKIVCYNKNVKKTRKGQLRIEETDYKEIQISKCQ